MGLWAVLKDGLIVTLGLLCILLIKGLLHASTAPQAASQLTLSHRSILKGTRHAIHNSLKMSLCLQAQGRGALEYKQDLASFLTVPSCHNLVYTWQKAARKLKCAEVPRDEKVQGLAPQ